MPKKILESISFALVNFNTKHLLKNILSPLEEYGEKNEIKLNFFLFNNSPKENLSDLVGKYNFINLNIFKSKKNLGYAPAIQSVIEKVNTNYILLINPDCKFSFSQLEEFFNKLNNYPEPFSAAVCDITLGKNDKLYYSGIATITENWKIAYNRNSTGWKFACGAFILYHLPTLKKIGSIDKSYVMYFEDADISLRLQINGYKLISVSLKKPIEHFVGYTSQTFLKKLKVKYYFYRNLFRLRKRFKKFKKIKNIDYI